MVTTILNDPLESMPLTFVEADVGGRTGELERLASTPPDIVGAAVGLMGVGVN